MRTNRLPIVFGYFILISVLTSCKAMYPSIMMQTKSDYTYSKIPDKADSVYTIGVNDELSLELYANDGIKMIDILSSGIAADKNTQKLTYWVEFDGTARMPVIGRLKLSGLTIREAEELVESQFAKVYNNPFARLKVENRRAIVYPGNGGTAKVIPLQQPDVTLMEAIAEAGGISESGKAYRIKLVRGDYDNPQVFLFNLRKIEGLKDADMILQPGDLIYVEERRSSQIFVREVLPWLSSATALLGLSLTVYTLTKIK